MKHIPFYSALFIGLFIVLPFSQAQNLLENGSFNHNLKGWDIKTRTDKADATYAIVTDLNNEPVLKVNVNEVTDDYWAFKFHQIALTQSDFAVERFDIFTLSFRVKGQGDELLLQAGITEAPGDTVGFWQLQDQAMVNIPVTSEWQYHAVEMIASENIADAQFELRFGEKTGTYLIDDVVLEKTGSYQVHREWMKNADRRIDSLRKANVEIIVVDKDDQPVEDARVKVNLSSHTFMWGTSVYWVTPGRWNNDRYQWEREQILKTFNTIVNEDDFKWPQMEPKRDKVIYRNVDLYAEWARENNLRMRGHCLVWPKQGVFLPKWFEALPGDEAIDALKTRIQREMNYYEGQICEYDVLNEPVHNPFLGNWLGDSIYHDMYTWARNADPSAGLYVNEWWNFDYWDHYRFRTYVDSLLAAGTPLDGLGLQGHMDRPFNWLQFKFKLDYLAEAGLPLKITEFDVNVDQLGLTLEEQAQYYSDIMHLAFSHPAMNGFLIWGLTDGWRDNSGIYNDDLSPRPAAEMMHHLIKEKWHTTESGNTNENGSFSFTGFKGWYNVTVSTKNGDKNYRILLDEEKAVRLKL